MSDITIDATANADAKVIKLDPGTMAIVDSFDLQKGTVVEADVKICAVRAIRGEMPRHIPEGYTWIPQLAPSEILGDMYYEVIGRHRNKAVEHAMVKAGKWNWDAYAKWYKGEILTDSMPYVQRVIDRLLEGKSVVIAAPFANLDNHYLNMLQEIIAEEAASVQGCRIEPAEEELASDESDTE